MKILNSVPIWLLLLWGMQGCAQDREPKPAAPAVVKQAQCPARDFQSFLNAFSESVELQKMFTHFPLKKQHLDADAEPEPKPVMESFNKDKIAFPLIPNSVGRKKMSLSLRIDEQNGNKAKVTLSGQDTDYLVSYFFIADSCWQLIRIEDWSL